MLNERFDILRRVATIAVMAALTLAIGHVGLRGVVETLTQPGERIYTREMADVPRPPRSELYSGVNAPKDPGRLMVRYFSDAGVDELAAFYRREMPLRGWHELPVPADETEYPGVFLVYSNSAGNWCDIAISRSDARGGSAVTVIRMPRRS